MSMILCLMRASDADLGRLQENPKGLQAFLGYPQPTAEDVAQQAKVREDMRKAMAAKGYTMPPDPLVEPWVALPQDSYDFSEQFDIDKMWHGLYYLLTGTAYEGAPPAGWLLNSPPIGDDAFGYGPAMAISAAHTRELSGYLNGLRREAVLGRFDAAIMMGLNLYPNIWDEDENELKEELGEAFDKLKAYVENARIMAWA